MSLNIVFRAELNGGSHIVRLAVVGTSDFVFAECDLELYELLVWAPSDCTPMVFAYRVEF